jgi:hypothetical protein
LSDEDPKYLAWLRTRRCTVKHADGHRGPTQAHHSNVHGKGMGQRSHDHAAIPLCAHHHRCWHDHSQYFAGWTKAQRRAWTDEAIAKYRALYTCEPDTTKEDILNGWDQIF